MLYVSEAKFAIRIHRNLICDASPFFSSAFMGTGTFTETTEQSMTLPEDSLEVVSSFVSWLYKGYYPLPPYTTAVETHGCYTELAKLYVFADKYDVARLHNHIIDRLFQLKNKTPFPPQLATVKLIYRNTYAGSSFRKLLVTHYASHIGMEWYSNDDISSRLLKIPEFAADLAVALGRLLDGKYKSLFDGPASALYATNKPNTQGGKDEGGEKTSGAGGT